MIGVVVVRSASRRTINDIAIYRPGKSMPNTVVIMVMYKASNAEIISAVRGLVSDEELAAVHDALDSD
jgi:hypothetical protein